MIIEFNGEVCQIKEYPQAELIYYAKDFKCQCGKIDFLTTGEAPIGYCSTNSGYMAVFECPHCYEKTRFHIQTTGRYELDKFKEEVGLMIHLYNHR